MIYFNLLKATMEELWYDYIDTLWNFIEKILFTLIIFIVFSIILIPIDILLSPLEISAIIYYFTKHK